MVTEQKRNWRKLINDYLDHCDNGKTPTLQLNEERRIALRCLEEYENP
jgi:hypothetical protein